MLRGGMRQDFGLRTKLAAAGIFMYTVCSIHLGPQRAQVQTRGKERWLARELG